MMLQHYSAKAQCSARTPVRCRVRVRNTAKVKALEAMRSLKQCSNAVCCLFVCVSACLGVS